MLLSYVVKTLLEIQELKKLNVKYIKTFQLPFNKANDSFICCTKQKSFFLKQKN